MPTDADRAPSPGDRWWTLGLTTLLVLPLIVSALYLWFSVGSSYVPWGDNALIELRMRDVLDHAVYVGPYSRYGWSHPGPFLFYLLAVPYKLTGSRSISMHVTALFVNAATIAGVAWVAFRRGRLPVVVAVLVPTGLLTHALGADFLRDPWNPHLPVLPLLLLMLLAWSVAIGDRWMLPIAVVVVSFTMQSHVGLAVDSLAVLGTGIIGLVWVGWHRPESERRSWWMRTGVVVGVSALVGIVLWAPTLWGTLVVRDGNLGSIVSFFRTRSETAGLHTALEVMGLQWGPRPEWIFGSLGTRGSIIAPIAKLEGSWWAAVWLLLAGAATAVAVRRRAAETIWLAVVVWVGVAAGLLAANSIVGDVYPYLIQWTWVIGAGLGILVLRGAWLTVEPDRRARVLRGVVPVAAVLLGVLCVMGTIDALNAGTPSEGEQRRQHRIDDQVLAALPPGNGPVQIDSRIGFEATGLALALERRGIHVDMAPDNDVVYGSERSPTGGPYRAKLALRLGAGSGKEPGRRIAHFSSLPASAAASLRAYRKALRDTPPGPKHDALLEFLRRAGGVRSNAVSVYLVEP